jgi:antitoxin ParD1/3/4
MNFSLTPELEEYIHNKVKTGLYHSASEVIREGLRLLREQDELRSIRLKQLRADVEAGLDDAHNGRVSVLDPKETIRKAKARRSRKKA